MQRTHWTAHDKEVVRSSFKQGLSDIDIATKLGRTVKAVVIQRGHLDCVHYHIEREKGKQIGPRAKPRPGVLPSGSQLTLEGIPTNMSSQDALKINEAFYKRSEARKKKLLAGNEELYPGPAIQKTINSDVGISGTINIYNHDGEIDFTITNLSPRNAIHVMASIISKLV